MAQPGTCLDETSPVGKLLVVSELDRRQPLCPGSKGGHQLYNQEHGQKTEGKEFSGILHPHFRPPIQERYCQAGVGLAKGPQDNPGLKHFAVRRG